MISWSNDDIHALLFQLFEQCGNAIKVILGKKLFDFERARLYMAVRGKPIAECGQEVSGGSRIDPADEADVRSLRPHSLSEARADHPACQRGSAQNLDKLSPSQSIGPHASTYYQWWRAG
jgi:hypothetical protein